MIGFDGRHQWRRPQSFKLCANLPHCKKRKADNGLDLRGELRRATLRRQKMRPAQLLCVAQKLSKAVAGLPWRGARSGLFGGSGTGKPGVFQAFRVLKQLACRLHRLDGMSTKTAVCRIVEAVDG